MTDNGRSWYGIATFENSTPCLDHRVTDQTPPKCAVMAPISVDVSVVKAEPVRDYASYTPSGKQVDCSLVKTEPLHGIKSEPFAYLERALVKGEFPLDFNWPYMKWNPLPEICGVKKEEKHYIPKPRTNVFSRLDGNFRPFIRRRNLPPPNWKYIYSRQTYQPTEAAKAWWNESVERALKKRRDAYLLTKQKDKVPIEIRMERLWSFEVAKDEVRRVVAESKCKALLDIDSADKGYGINGGASTSTAGCLRDESSILQNIKSPLRERLGELATVVEDNPTCMKMNTFSSTKESLCLPNFGVKMNTSSPSKESLGMPKIGVKKSSTSAVIQEVEIIPKDADDNIEVYTIDDEIEDAMSNSDESDIAIISEENADVIFMQKKQGEVTFIAQVDGRVVKMNRKRKLCVTVLNSAKRHKTVTIDIEQNGSTDGINRDDDICLLQEQSDEDSAKITVQPCSKSNNVVKQSNSSVRTIPYFEMETEENSLDTNILVGNVNDLDNSTSDENVQMLVDSAPRSKGESVDTNVDKNLLNILDVETSVTDRDSCCSSVDVIEECQVSDINITNIEKHEGLATSIANENEIVVEATMDGNFTKKHPNENGNIIITVPDVDTVIDDDGTVIEAEGNRQKLTSVDYVSLVESDEKDDGTESIKLISEEISVWENEDTDDSSIQEADVNTVKDGSTVEKDKISEKKENDSCVKDFSEEICVLESEDTDDSSMKDKISEKKGNDSCVKDFSEEICVLESEDTDDSSIQEAGIKAVTECSTAEKDRRSKGKVKITLRNSPQREVHDDDEDILIIKQQEIEEEFLDEVICSDASELCPQKVDTTLNFEDKETPLVKNNNNHNLHMTGTTSEEVKILEEAVVTSPKEKSKVIPFASKSDSGNASSTVANIRQTRQSTLENRSPRVTRQRSNKNALPELLSSYSFRNRNKKF